MSPKVIYSLRKIVSSKQPQTTEGPADFETAIAATGFGKFNVILLLISVPAAWASAVNTTAIAYATPFAGCDFDLTLADKGVLNAVVFAGMVSSAFVWGFFSDAFGRKKLMIGGFLINGLFVVVSGLSQSFGVLLFGKLMDGVTSIGAYAIFTSCLSEFHSLVYRSRVLMFFGVLMGSSFIIMPLLGLAILTTTIEINLFDGGIILHNWNVLLLITAIPSIVTGLCIVVLPESPKYLMSMRENEKALEIFKEIYSVNSGRHPDTYPVKELQCTHIDGKDGENNIYVENGYMERTYKKNSHEEKSDKKNLGNEKANEENSDKKYDHEENIDKEKLNMEKAGMEKSLEEKANKNIADVKKSDTPTNRKVKTRQKLESFKEALRQLKSLFLKPHGFVMLQVFTVHFGMFSGSNTLSAWFPQIFSTINDYTCSHGGADADVCTMLETIQQSSNATVLCSDNSQNTGMFLNLLYPTSFVVFTVCVATFLLKYFGQKQIYFVCGMISGVGAICIYFSSDTNAIILLTTISWSFSTVCGMTMIVMVVDLFPTTLRAMAISLTMISGRLGTMVGNIVFPYLLQWGCLAPFLTIGLTIILATGLMTTLPRTNLKTLE